MDRSSNGKRTCNAIAVCFHVLALGFGCFALVLPYWSSGSVEEVRNVTIVKELDSGIITEHSGYHMKEDPNSFEISGTFFNPDVAKIVTDLLITGLILLVLALIHSIYKCLKTKKTSAKVSLFMSIITLIAGGFISSCPLIYKIRLVDDLESENISVGASWWLSLLSAISAFLVGLGTACQPGLELYDATSEGHKRKMTISTI